MGYMNTRQEILDYIAQETEKLQPGHYDALTAAAVCERLNVSRNLASQYLNEGFKEGILLKVSTRPVYFLDRKLLLECCTLTEINDEFCDLDELTEFIKKHLNKKQNFEQAVGCRLSLKSAVEKCRVAVDYPPAGLPLYIEGARGTGKSFLAWLSYCYAKDTEIVPEESKYLVIDAKTLNAQKLLTERIREELEKKLRKIGKGDFVIFEDYDELPEELQLYILHFIEERQTAEKQSLGRYVLTLKNGDCYEEYRKKLTFIRVTLPELSERSQVEKEMLLSHFLKKEEQRLGKQIRISERAYRTLSQHLFTENIGELEHCIKQLCAKAFSVRRSQKEIRIDLLMLPKELLLGIQMEFQRQLGEEKQAALTILLNHIRDAHNALPIQAFIICHGYATASSIADVCNKLMKKHVFHAIDMPYDMSVTEVGKQLRNILYYNENRDVLMLVDLGSLENIEEVIGDVSNINFGIINNVSTNLALEIGFAVSRGEPMADILKEARENVKTSYKLMERAHKEDVIMFVSESGSDVAARVGELFMDSLPKNLELTVKCYDYDTFTELGRTGELDKYNVLFVATTTVPVQTEKFPVISLEEIITFNSFPRLRECFNGYLSSEEFEQFRKNLLNVFSLQNVVEALTILNAGKVLSQVDAMLEELQVLMKRKFLEKTIVGLNIHISCLIERLVKKEAITTHLNLEHFKEEHGDFVRMVEKSFENIARQYNIRLVMSEIAYIYDYIHFEDGTSMPKKEEDF